MVIIIILMDSIGPSGEGLIIIIIYALSKKKNVHMQMCKK